MSKSQQRLNYSLRNGKYIEHQLNQLHQHYSEHKQALVFKCEPVLRVIRQTNSWTLAKCISQAPFDYFGLFKTQFLGFEVKQVSDDVFYLTALTTFQHHCLKLVDQLGGKSFVMIYFIKYRQYWLIPTNEMLKWSSNKITYQEMEMLGQLVPIIFQSWPDYLKLFES